MPTGEDITLNFDCGLDTVVGVECVVEGLEVGHPDAPTQIAGTLPEGVEHSGGHRAALECSIEFPLPVKLEKGQIGRKPAASLKTISVGMTTLGKPLGVTRMVSAGTMVVLPVPRGLRSLGPSKKLSYGVSDGPTLAKARGG
jgi:hypothetical protein